MVLSPLGRSGSNWASPGDHLPASTTCATTSTCASAWVTTRFIMRFMAPPCRVWKPGVSTNTYCACSRRSEEHTSELQSLMRISYAVFCLKQKTKRNTQTHDHGIQTKLNQDHRS